jgi:hypothetical protein
MKEGWYEVHDFDDIEAMRQTYKRNLGGTNNPIKLGLMFERAIKEAGISNRELAEKWDLSEGTIRNYLLYAEVSKLRNDYANLEKLSVKQIRIYKTLAAHAKRVADLWFYFGADPDALNIWNDRSYNTIYESQGERLEEFVAFQEINDSGFADSWYIQENSIISQDKYPELKREQRENFKKLLKDVEKKIQLKRKIERNFTWGIIGQDHEAKLLAKKYVDIFFNHPLMRKKDIPSTFAPTLFSKVITRDDAGNLQFLLTIDELNECLNLKNTKTYYDHISYARLLIAKKYNKAPSEIKDGFTSMSIEEQLDEAELNKNGSEVLKKLQLPFKIKTILYNAKISDEIIPIVGERITMAYRAERLSIYDTDEELKNKVYEEINYINKKLQEQVEEKRLQTSTPEQLADVIVEQIKSIWKTPKEEEITDFKQRLSKHFNQTELYVFSYLARKYYDEDQYKQTILKLHEDIKKIKGI